MVRRRTGKTGLTAGDRVRPICLTITIVVCLGVCLGFFPAEGSGGESTTVERVDADRMEKIVRTAPGRCVVVFMAAWCMPCIDELPDLNRLYAKYGPQGMKMVGFSLDLEGPEAIEPILKKCRVRFPVFWVGEAAVEKYNITGIPLLWFVKDGEVVEKLAGKRPRKFLERKFEEFFN
jgi:thiol-disulfide isomerase/thioredoxin